MLPTKPLSTMEAQGLAAALETPTDRDCFEVGATQPVTAYPQALGPIHYFNASTLLTPSSFRITADGQGYGLTLGGNAPVWVCQVMAGSPADRAGMTRGAALVSINGASVKFAMHEEVVRRIREGGGTLELAVQGAVALDTTDGELDHEPVAAAAAPGGYFGAMPGASPAHLSFGLAGRRPSVAVQIADDGVDDFAYRNPLYRRSEIP